MDSHISQSALFDKLNKKTSIVKPVFFVIFLLLLANIVNATTITSTVGGGVWATGTTWVGGIAPAVTDQAVIVGPVTVGATITQTTTGTVTINSGGTVTATTGGTTITFMTLTINTGGTLTSSRVLTVNGATNITGTIILSGARLNIFTGNVTLNSGATWNNTTTSVQTFSGNFTNNASTFTASGTGGYTFSAPGGTISGATTTVHPTILFTGAFTNSGTITASTLLTVTGVVLTNNGTITATTSLAGTGGVTQSATGILNIAGACPITTLTNAGIINRSGTGTTTTALANFTNTGTINISGSGAITGITNNAAGIVNHSGSSTITSFNNATSTSTLNISTTHTVPAFTILTVSAAGNTVNYKGAGPQTVKVAAYSNLILSGSGAKTFAVTTVNNDLTLSGSATATTGAALSVGGILTVGAGTTLATGATNTWTLSVGGATAVSGTLTLANTSAKTFTGDVTVNSGGVWNETAVEAVTFGGSLSNKAATWTASTGVHLFSGSAKTISGTTATVIPSVSISVTIANSNTLTVATLLTVGGTLTNNGTVTATTALSGAGNFANASGAILNIGGTSGITSLTPSTSSNLINYTGAAPSIHLPTTNPYYNLALSGSGNNTFGGATAISGNLSISGTAAAILPNGTTSSSLTLTLGGVNQSTGSWGGTGSSATHKDLARFGSTTTGILNVFASCTVGDWLGGFSTDWNDAGNWCGGIPTATTDVNIPSAPANQPVIGAAGGLCRNITINSSASLTITGSNSLTVSGNWVSTGGTFTYNTSTVVFGGSAAQAISDAVTFYNLTINNAAGVTSATNQTVNGVLYLQSANASATQGCLEMGANTLNMGASATTTGTGDVTGTVSRTTFVAGAVYSFGNQYTTIDIASGGTLPTAISFIIDIGAAPSWKTSAVQRSYDIVRTGGAGTTITLQLHFLTSEIQANTEANLIIWDYHQSISRVDEHGKSSQNTTNHWVAISNRSITYLAASPGDHLWGLANKTSGDFVWQGTASTDWNDANNWTGNAVPSNTSAVVIPDAATTSNDPVFPLSPAGFVLTMEMQSGAIIDGGTGTTLTVAGSGGAWLNLGGTLNPGTSTVLFINNGVSVSASSATVSGATNFYNLTIDAASRLKPQTDDTIGIAGALTINGTGVLDADDLVNTVDYNGGSQIVLNPNGFSPGYHHLILSGSGTKTLPSGTMNITGDFTNKVSFAHNSGTVVFKGTAAQAINSGGSSFNNLTIMNTTDTCKASTYGITVAGTFTTNVNTILDMAAFAFSVSTVAHSGTLITQNVSAAPITTAKTWGGTVKYNSASGQNIIKGNYNNLDGTGGNRTLSSTGTVGIAGTFTVGAGTYTITSSTVDFNGTAAQSIPAFNFNNLTISGNKGGGAMTLVSADTIGVATVFSVTATNTSYVVTGNTFDYNGSGAQTITAFTYNFLVTSTSGIKTILTATTVNCQTIDVNNTSEMDVAGTGLLNVLKP